MRVLVGSGADVRRAAQWLEGARKTPVDDVIGAVLAFCDGWEREDPFDAALLDGSTAWARLAVARFRNVERLLGVEELQPVRVIVVDGRVGAWPGGARVDAWVRRPVTSQALHRALEDAGLLDGVA